MNGIAPSKPVRGGWRYYRNLLVFTVITVLVAIVFVIPIYDAITSMHPRRYPIGSVSPADLGLDYEEVTLTTEDGLRLRGWYVPAKNGAAVILVHAFNGNRTGTLYHAALLAEHGYGVILYDTRTQGESEGDLYAMGWDAYRDVFAALDYLETRPEVDPRRIGVLGLSAGAKIALFATAKTDRIAAVVAEGGGYFTFNDWFFATDPSQRIWAPSMWVTYTTVSIATRVREPIPLRLAVAQISDRPVYLISAENDRFSNQAYFEAAGEPKTFWLRKEPGHIEALFAQHDEYEQRVIGFFDQALQK